MQGTAADIIKRAMIQLDQKLQNDPDIAMIMQVHDELVFEVRSEKVAFYSELIKTQMESAADLVVPLIVDVGQALTGMSSLTNLVMNKVIEVTYLRLNALGEPLILPI